MGVDVLVLSYTIDTYSGENFADAIKEISDAEAEVIRRCQEFFSECSELILRGDSRNI